MPHSKFKILVVDDDKRLRELLNQYLEDKGYEVDNAQNAQEAQQKLQEKPYDLMVVDVMMPGETGFALTHSIRAEETTSYHSIPILLLTAMGETEDRIKGLEFGADDYMSKPFDPKELLLRIQKILKRHRATEPFSKEKVEFGGFKYNVSQRSLYKENEIIYLTSTETELLHLLTTNPGLALSRDDLSERSGFTLSPRTIDVQITRLRKKIEQNPKEPRFIKTVRHKGYIFAGE